jgi:hypothetical protein
MIQYDWSVSLCLFKSCFQVSINFLCLYNFQFYILVIF